MSLNNYKKLLLAIDILLLPFLIAVITLAIGGRIIFELLGSLTLLRLLALFNYEHWVVPVVINLAIIVGYLHSLCKEKATFNEWLIFCELSLHLATGYCSLLFLQDWLIDNNNTPNSGGAIAPPLLCKKDKKLTK